MYLKWQDAYKDLLKERTPLEDKIFKNVKITDAKAEKIYKDDSDKAIELLTTFSSKTTDDIHNFYTNFRYKLLIKYTNNKQGINFQ